MPTSDSESPPRVIRPTPPPELPARQPSIELSKFEPFPELEPFPFKPDPPRPEKKKAGYPPVRKPGKFVRGESRESDYESDLEGARIAPRWVPPGSDTDDAVSYKKVQPKLASEERTSRAVSKEPTPPSQFDVPPEMDGPPRPKVLPVTPPTEIIEAPEIATLLPVSQSRPSLSPSPKPPSAEALAMEKSWTTKRVEAESKTVTRTASPGAGQHPKPSAKALEMEKQWSHRFTSHSSKIWPPPPADHEPSVPIWTGQISSSSSTVVETTLETVNKKSILKQTNVAPCPPSVQPSRHVQIQGEEEDKVVPSLPISEPVALKPASKEVPR